MIIYNRTEYAELTNLQYRKEKRRLQIELLKLQEWTIDSGERVAILLEGRDAAGKGSTIQRFIENGLKLIKIYLSLSKENQKLRFQFRRDHDLKYWKLSKNDWKAHKNWQLFTDYKEQMFEQTSTEKAPWVVINSDNKMIARLNAIRYVLSKIDYPNRKDLKPKKWTKESPVYNISLFNTQFNSLNREQYELLNRLKGHE